MLHGDTLCKCRANTLLRPAHIYCIVPAQRRTWLSVLVHCVSGSGVTVLLCLLWSLVEVHSQTAPYVSFMEETLPNHTYVDLSLVGSSGSDSVRCHTDLGTCCMGTQGTHRGDWFAPGSEMRLPFSSDASADIYEVRGDQRVDLRRRNNADMPSGIYRCFIATNAVHDDDEIVSVREAVYVGLYATGGKTFLTCLLESKIISYYRRYHTVWWCDIQFGL